MIFKKKYRIELAKTLTGHWYHVFLILKSGKEKNIGVFPSSTTILNAYPQSQFLTKWIADNGWNEAQRIKGEAGERGTRIHAACDILEEGGTLREEDYSLDEWYKINSFVLWHHEYDPKLITQELAIFSRNGGYAGRLDRLYEIKGRVVLLDLKSGSGIHEHFPLQFASYANAIEENTDVKVDLTAALQLGNGSKAGYRYVEYKNWQEHYKVFKNVKETWNYSFFGSKKTKKEAPVLVLPATLSL